MKTVPCDRRAATDRGGFFCVHCRKRPEGAIIGDISMSGTSCDGTVLADSPNSVVRCRLGGPDIEPDIDEPGDAGAGWSDNLVCMAIYADCKLIYDRSVCSQELFEIA